MAILTIDQVLGTITLVTRTGQDITIRTNAGNQAPDKAIMMILIDQGQGQTTHTTRTAEDPIKDIQNMTTTDQDHGRAIRRISMASLALSGMIQRLRPSDCRRLANPSITPKPERHIRMIAPSALVHRRRSRTILTTDRDRGMMTLMIHATIVPGTTMGMAQQMGTVQGRQGVLILIHE